MQQSKNGWKAKALFLRAWWALALLQRYGGRTDDGEALGYPIITRFITIEEGKHPENFKRNTYQECVRQIMEDCDQAMKKLPDTYTGDDAIVGIENTGRATSLAAAVLKSRVALYSASPAFQSSKIVTLNHGADYSIADQEAYQKQWEYAALISNAVLLLDGFGSYTPLTASNLADAPTTTPADFVFRNYYNTNGMETNHFPLSTEEPPTRFRHKIWWMLFRPSTVIRSVLVNNMIRTSRMPTAINVWT